MQLLEIRLLGPSIVRLKGDLVPFKRRFPRALLFYLATKGNLVHRDTILDLFWDCGASNSRRRLSENLSRLRASLPESDILISYDQLVGLNFEKVQVDLLHYQDLLDQTGRTPWQIPNDEPLPPHISQLLIEANDLWQGPYAFQGINIQTAKFDSWLQVTAERLHNSRFNILTRLADHAYVTQNLPTALELARTALRYDNFSESLHFKIMRYLVKMEQIDEARQYFEETRELMMDELGVHPSPQMIKLYQNIRISDNLEQTNIEPIWEVHSSLGVPFVGRKDAMIAINRAINENQGIFLLGESGQGKTRLMQEYIAELQPQPRVLISNCRPTESSLPFHPIIEVLRRHVTPDEWLTLSSVWASHLTGLLPELVQMREDLKPASLPDDSTQSRAMILESIRQIFVLMNQNRPLFLVIDDAHWTDKATLSTIAYLLTREPFSNSASLAILARFEYINDYLRVMLDSIQQSKHATIYQLNHLRRENITDLTHNFLESEPSDQFIDRLLDDTGGNTFFVLEILRAIMETEEGTFDLKTQLPVTDNLQSLLVSRIQKLSTKARKTLEVAAIIGPQFSIQVLGKSCHYLPEDLTPILIELENNLLVKPYLKRPEELYYQFNHDKIRETLLNRIQPAYAQILHVRVVNALSLHKTPEAAVLAHHYSGAGEVKIAFQYWIKAAKRARSLFAMEDASSDYAYAEALIQHCETQLSNNEIYQFYADWSDLTYNINETELLLDIGKSLVQIGESRDDHMLTGAGLNILSDASFTINDFEGGLAYAIQAIQHLEQSRNTFEHIEAYNHQGASLYMLNRLDEAVIAFQDALSLSTDKPDTKIFKARSNSHYQTALLQILKGSPNSAYSHGRKAFEYAELSQYTYSIVMAYGIQALAQFYMGNFADSRKNSLTGIQLAGRTQAWRMLGYLHSYAAMAEVALGYLDSGRKHAEEAIQLGERFGYGDIIGLGYRQLGELHRLIFDYSKAAFYHQQGVDAISENFIGLDNLYRLGLVQHYLGHSHGIEQIKLAQTLLAKNKVGVGVIAAKICQALVNASRNQWSETRQLALELEADTLDGGLANYHITTVLLLAEAALVEEELESAYEHFQFAAGEARFTKNPWLELKAQTGIRWVRKAQNRDAAKPGKRINELLDQFESNIAHPDTRKAFTLFRQRISNGKNINTIPL